MSIKRSGLSFFIGAMLALLVGVAHAAPVYVTMQPPTGTTNPTAIFPGMIQGSNGSFVVTDASTVGALISRGWVTVNAGGATQPGSMTCPTGAACTVTGYNTVTPGVNTVGAVVFRDQFQRANTAAGTLGTAPTGQTWLQTGSQNMQILNDRGTLAASGGAANNTYAYVNLTGQISQIGLTETWVTGTGSGTDPGLTIGAGAAASALQVMIHAQIGSTTVTLSHWETGSSNSFQTSRTNGVSITTPTVGVTYTEIVTRVGNQVTVEVYDAAGTFDFITVGTDSNVTADWGTGTQPFWETGVEQNLAQCATCAVLTSVWAYASTPTTVSNAAPMTVQPGIDDTAINPTSLKQVNAMILGVGRTDPCNGSTNNCQSEFFNSTAASTPHLDLDANNNSTPFYLNFINTKSGGFLGGIAANSSRTYSTNNQLYMDNGLGWHLKVDGVDIFDCGQFNGGGTSTGCKWLNVAISGLGTCNTTTKGSVEYINNNDAACTAGNAPSHSSCTAGTNCYSCHVGCGGQDGALAWTIIGN